ncbi:hypothetical protein [Microbacterium sp.]|uniref:hypothetical protein n=1 Tax=Microbacterium sp. TaxID=51671 RepID=UPI0028AF56E2|nr:hypothetical protein [Microbacterium sp.]
MDNDEKTPATSTAPADSTADAGADTKSPGRGRRRTRTILIGAGAAVALLAFGGGAYAIGAAVGDDDDDRPGIHAPGSHDDDARDGRSAPGRHDDDGDDDDRGGEGSAAWAPADAAALRSAAEAAIEHASAEGITSIEVERGGYNIDAHLADGTEVDLFVTPEGVVRERGDDDANDDRDDPVIDLARLGDILTAAQSAAGDAGAAEAAFHALSTSGSGAVYEVELRGGDRSEVEVDLDAELAVVRVDIDS